jgi:hypothetical protein
VAVASKSWGGGPMGRRVGVGVSWRHRGSAWPGQLGQLTGQQATAARGGSGGDGGGVG